MNKSFLVMLIIIIAFSIVISKEIKQGTHVQGSALYSGSEASKIVSFEMHIEMLRNELKIPGLSAAIIKDQKVFWAKGFGYADLENKLPATEHTAYHLASLTKPFASTILLQLVQEGKISLDDPVSYYGINLESDGVIRIKHLLSHTSTGKPGERYMYNGDRFAELDKVIQKVTGMSFADILIARIIEPLGMNETAPNLVETVHTKSLPGVGSFSENEIKVAANEFFLGYNSGSIELIEKHISAQQNSFDTTGGFLTYFVNPKKLRDKFKWGMKFQFDSREFEAAVYGDTAVSTCILTRTISIPGANPKIEGPWRTSLFWYKEHGIWKIIHAHLSPLTSPLISEKQKQRFYSISRILAQPYELDNSFNPVKSHYPAYFSTAAGLISTVLDIAKYDSAVDQNKLLTQKMQKLAFTPTTSTNGEILPYGLGWFIQNYKGIKLIWHFGYWNGNSSLILKIPEYNITFIAMANTDNLSRPADLGKGDVLASPIGLLFLKHYIFPEIFETKLPDINWRAPANTIEEQIKQISIMPYADIYKKELLAHALISLSTGNKTEIARLFNLYSKIYSFGLPEDLTKTEPIAQINKVGDNENRSSAFALAHDQRVRIFAIGESGEQMSDYGWIENAQNKTIIWEMQTSDTVNAGGSQKNRKIDTVITLPAGNYILHYKTDDSHSYNNWNSVPPDIYFWGIALYPAHN